MKVAINLCDLDEVNPRLTGINMIGLLLTDFVSDNPPTVEVEKGMVDGTAVVLDGPASQDEDRLTALVELLQTVIGPRKMGRPIRCYREGPRGGWTKIKVGG